VTTPTAPTGFIVGLEVTAPLAPQLVSSVPITTNPETVRVVRGTLTRILAEALGHGQTMAAAQVSMFSDWTAPLGAVWEPARAILNQLFTPRPPVTPATPGSGNQQPEEEMETSDSVHKGIADLLAAAALVILPSQFAPAERLDRRLARRRLWRQVKQLASWCW
jgi:hypothetical protein